MHAELHTFNGPTSNTRIFRPDDQITQEYRKSLGETLDDRHPIPISSAIALLIGVFVGAFLVALLVQKILVHRRRYLNIKGKLGASYVFRGGATLV